MEVIEKPVLTWICTVVNGVVTEDARLLFILLGLPGCCCAGRLDRTVEGVDVTKKKLNQGNKYGGSY